MPTGRKLSREQIEQVVEEYRAGKPMKEISKRFDIGESTVSYHVKRAGVPKRTKNYRNTASMCVLQEPERRCLKCGRLFRPYTFNLSLFRNICFDCWTLMSEVEAQPSNPIGRRV